jgi:hypothetical protein
MDRAAPARQVRNPVRFTRNQALNFEHKKDIDYYTKGADKLDGDVPQEVPSKGPPVQLDGTINPCISRTPLSKEEFDNALW